jgi:hypothetical protein
MALTRVADRAIVINKEGKKGDQGKPGQDGITTIVNKTIVEEKDGTKGDMPNHQVRNGEIRFENPDGTWGKWITVQPTSGGGGGTDTHNTYRLIEQAIFHVGRQDLQLGHNILGVNYNGDVTIILPDGIDKRAIIVVKDESNNAGTNNITVTTET